MQCVTHSEIAATGTCTYSGKPFCHDCLVEIESKYYGKLYLDRALTDIRERASSKSQPNVFMNAGGASSSTSPSTDVAPAFAMIVGDIPFYRKRWFIIIVSFIFPLISFLSAVSGPIYKNVGNGTWTMVSSGGKVILILWTLWACICFIAAFG